VPDRPATRANARRNAGASGDRARRWRGARDACWALLEPLVASGAAVAVCGAGNGDDLPLGRLAARAARVDLLDVDPAACRAGIRSVPRGPLRRRLRAVEADVTDGLADRIVAAAAADSALDAAGLAAPLARLEALPLGEPPYDLVVGDLLYSQLLFPGLKDAGLEPEAVDAALAVAGQPLTDAVVRRLAAAAPLGPSVHLDDPIAWWPGHEQPFGLDDVLAAASRSADEALGLIATGNRPIGTDPRHALRARIVQTAFWRWPFAAGVDYVVCASVAESPGSASATRSNRATHST
jgi:hypothetical protein